VVAYLISVLFKEIHVKGLSRACFSTSVNDYVTYVSLVWRGVNMVLQQFFFIVFLYMRSHGPSRG